MSTSDTPSPRAPQPPEPNDGPPPPPPTLRNGCLTAFMVIAGIILLLPGLCALIFGVGSLTSPGGFDSGFVPFILVGLIVGAVGVLMIRWAIRDPRG
jgi:hypothetical protein